MRILLADDHAMFRSGLRSILEQSFSDVLIEEASTCGEVLELLGKDRWNVAIVDIAMGGENSLKYIPEMKKLAPMTPVLVLSMYNEKQFIVQALRSGASGYITKEHTPAELVHGINSVLAGQRYLSESIARNLADYLAVNDGKEPHELLSARENEVFLLLATGRSVSEIAARLFLSVKTVSTYRQRILEKMNLRNNAELMRYALKQNLVS